MERLKKFRLLEKTEMHLEQFVEKYTKIQASAGSDACNCTLCWNWM